MHLRRSIIQQGWALPLLCAFLAGHLPTFAEEGSGPIDHSAARFERLDTADGLPHDSVYALAQDAMGFLWVGTEHGLARYDGYELLSLGSPKIRSEAPSDPDISALLEDRHGDLWIGTWGGGLDRYSPRSGRFERFPVDPKAPGHLRDDRVQTLFEDSQGVLWAGTFAGGLTRLIRAGTVRADGGTATTNDPDLRTFRHAPDDPSSLPHDRIWTIAEGGDNALWVGTEDGLARFDRSTGQFKTYRHDPGQPSSLPDALVRALFLDSKNVLWVGTRRGLARLEPESETFPRFELEDGNVGAVADLAAASINVFFEDHAGDLWIGTDEAGLYRLSEDRRRVDSFRFDPRDPNALSSDDVRAIYEDDARVLWIGTRGGGLSKLDLKPREFHHVSRSPDQPESLSGDRVSTFAEDGEGRLFVGTSSGLNLWDEARGRFRHVPLDDETTHTAPDDEIHRLYLDREGTLWVSVWRRGLYRIREDALEFDRLSRDPDDPDGLPSNTVTALLEDRQGRFWIGSDEGVALFDREAETFQIHAHAPDDPSRLDDDMIRVLAEDAAGGLWVGTDSGGLHRHDSEAESCSTFRHDPKEPSSPSHERIFDIFLDSSDRLWIGTAGGLDLWQGDRRFRRYGDAENLPEQSVLAITEDTAGALWLAAYDGLIRFDPELEEAHRYSAHDGLQDGHFLPGAALRRRDGRMLFGGTQGFNLFDPQKIVGNPHVPPVVLTDFRCLSKPHETELTLAAAPRIDLAPEDRFFSIEVAALDFSNPESNRYRFLLEGFDPGWSDATTQRSRDYIKVPAGDYTLRVQASNNDGVWNDEGLAVVISIAQPWWGTVWSKGLAALLALSLFGGLFLARGRRHAAREQELERRVDAGLSELRKSEKRYRQLYERNVAGVVRTALDGRILDCNDAFARSFGYTSTEECQRHHRLDLGDDPQGLLERLEEAGSFETHAKTRDGSEITLLWNASVVLDETSDALVIEGTAIDISERRRIEERAHREKKLESLAVLAGGVAHDFNNLLVGILGNAELARMELPPGSPLNEPLEDIERSAQRAASLAQKMLAYSGKGRFLTAPTDLSKKTGELVPVIDSEVLPGNRITLELELAPELPPVDLDAGQLRQLLTSLVANAAEAIDDQGTVTITTELRECSRSELDATFLGEDLGAGSYVALEVRDDGCGMGEDTRSKIFDPFFTTKFPGRGLGLAVVLGIVRGHGGTLVVESLPGKGTAVRIYLPISQAEPETTPEAAPSKGIWRGQGTVLLVDDEPVVRKIGSRMLELLGFDVITAADGEEGVDIFRRRSDEIVLVMLDLTMPRMNGEEAFAKLREVRPDTRVILASGYDETETIARFNGRGLSGFVHKPYHLATLRQKVRKALDEDPVMPAT